MQPIHELLARIRWDAEFSRARFRLGYWDRVAGVIRYVDLAEVIWDKDNPAFFRLVDEDGRVHEIPFHRVREVWRNDALIWQRHPESGGHHQA
jgi:uncharacterized protein (UPF0248 family)